MKKLLILLSLFVLLLTSCDKEPTKEYTLHYKIYYPNNVKEYKVYNNHGYTWYSDRGSNSITARANWLSNDGGVIERTTADIEIISYTIRNLDIK